MQSQQGPSGGPGPLVDFLIAVCHSTELLELFQEDPAAALDRWDPEHTLLPGDEQRELLARGSLDEIEAAVRDEYPDASIAIWVAGPVPIHRPIHDS